MLAIAHYCSKGNFRRAATHKQNLGELFEVELGDDGRAAAAYEEAAGWYESVSVISLYHISVVLYDQVLTPGQDNAEVRPRNVSGLLNSSNPAQALANKLWLKTADLVALEGKDCEYCSKILMRMC